VLRRPGEDVEESRAHARRVGVQATRRGCRGVSRLREANRCSGYSERIGGSALTQSESVLRRPGDELAGLVASIGEIDSAGVSKC
jgi:hypothetical protein